MPIKNNKAAEGFAICGALLSILFFISINYLTSPSYPWFIYPVYAVLWWPLSVIVPNRFGSIVYSVEGSLLTIAFLSAVNFISSPDYPWILFALLPLLLWPVCVIAGKKMRTIAFSVAVFVAVSAYYIFLNVTLANGFPWSMFVVYAALWWPLALFFCRKGHAFAFSIAGTLISSILFYYLNLITTPYSIWFVYPVFALLWWPLTLYFFSYKKRKQQTQ